MVFDYTRIKATADRLVQEFGQSATLVKKRKSGPEYNPTITEQNIPVIAVDAGNKTIGFKDGRSSQVREGANILTTEREILIAPGNLTQDQVPQSRDCIIINGETLSIWEVEVVKPGPVVVLYKCKIEN